MSGETLVQVEHVSKKFSRSLKRSLWYGLKDVASELTGARGEDRMRLRKSEFVAVDDVSFELRRGECLGLIGPNGSGKSTLLKMLNGIVRPDAGRITVRGRVGALIELGAGFNPILTGRENIFVNGAVLGLSTREVRAKLDEIVAFAELDEFIDAPVQSYSSGMKVRLGFAVAAHLEPDVLLVDEVLAVGDVGFRAKCYNRMYELAGSCGLIFVSHSMPDVSRLCDRALLLDHGRTRVLSDDVPRVLHTYTGSERAVEGRLVEREGDRLHGFWLEAPLTEGGYVTEFGSKLDLIVDASLSGGSLDVECSFTFLDSGQHVVAQLDSLHAGHHIAWTEERMEVRVRVPYLPLNPGEYWVSVVLRNEITNEIRCWHHAALRLIVRGGFFGATATQLLGSWTEEPLSEPRAQLT